MNLHNSGLSLLIIRGPQPHPEQRRPCLTPALEWFANASDLANRKNQHMSGELIRPMNRRRNPLNGLARASFWGIVRIRIFRMRGFAGFKLCGGKSGQSRKSCATVPPALDTGPANSDSDTLPGARRTHGRSDRGKRGRGGDSPKRLEEAERWPPALDHAGKANPWDDTT